VSGLGCICTLWINKATESYIRTNEVDEIPTNCQSYCAENGLSNAAIFYPVVTDLFKDYYLAKGVRVVKLVTYRIFNPILKAWA